MDWKQITSAIFLSVLISAILGAIVGFTIDSYSYGNTATLYAKIIFAISFILTLPFFLFRCSTDKIVYLSMLIPSIAFLAGSIVAIGAAILNYLSANSQMSKGYAMINLIEFLFLGGICFFIGISLWFAARTKKQSTS